jgi:hypothetical protein
MNPIKAFFNNLKQNKYRQERVVSEHNSHNKGSFQNFLTFDESHSKIWSDPFNDLYLCNAWVNIAVNILIRNLARADFVLERDGVELHNGSLYSLFH